MCLWPKYCGLRTLGPAWFMSDLVGNPEDRFSLDEAQIKCGCEGVSIRYIGVLS